MYTYVSVYYVCMYLLCVYAENTEERERGREREQLLSFAAAAENVRGDMSAWKNGDVGLANPAGLNHQFRCGYISQEPTVFT